MGIAGGSVPELLLGVPAFGVLLQVVYHGVAYGIGECRLFPHENILGQVVPLEGMAQQILALAVVGALHLRVQSHHILHKVQISEGHPGFQGVDADAAVCPEHIVHMELPDPLLRFLLEFLGGGGEVRIFVAEQLIGDFAGEQHPQIRMLMDILTHQIHTDGGPDGGDVVGAQQRHHLGQGFQNVLLGDDDLRMVRADVIRHLPGVFQVDGVQVHADGEGPDGLLAGPRRHGADQAGIQAAGEEEAHGGIGIQPLFNARHQLVMDLFAGGLQAVGATGLRGSHIPVADELSVLIVVSRREGQDPVAQAHQVLGLAGKDGRAVPVVAIVQRPDADGVPGGNELLAVIQDQGKFRVQVPEHLHALLLIQGQQDLAVGLALEGIALSDQLFFYGPEAVNFAVAYHRSVPPEEGLHACLRQAHDGQPVEAQKAPRQGQHPGLVRPPGHGAVKIRPNGFGSEFISKIADNGTHMVSSFSMDALSLPHQCAHWCGNPPVLLGADNHKPDFVTNPVLETLFFLPWKLMVYPRWSRRGGYQPPERYRT